MQVILDLLTDTQLVNLENKVWRKMTAGNGYQPFGYDRPTLSLTNPEELATLDAIRKERKERNI